jgi:hypothetical protein
VKPAELVNAIHAIAREIADYYNIPFEDVMGMPVEAFIRLRRNLPRWTWHEPPQRPQTHAAGSKPND